MHKIVEDTQGQAKVVSNDLLPEVLASMSTSVPGGVLGGGLGYFTARAVGNLLAPKEVDAEGRKYKRPFWAKTLLPLAGLYGGSLAGAYAGTHFKDDLVRKFRAALNSVDKDKSTT